MWVTQCVCVCVLGCCNRCTAWVHYHGDNKMFSFRWVKTFFGVNFLPSAYKLNVTLHSSMQTSSLSYTHTHACMQEKADTQTHTHTHTETQLFWKPNAISRIFGCVPVPNRKTLHIFHLGTSCRRGRGGAAALCPCRRRRRRRYFWYAKDMKGQLFPAPFAWQKLLQGTRECILKFPIGREMRPLPLSRDIHFKYL